jgi:hypothetical protein
MMKKSFTGTSSQEHIKTDVTYQTHTEESATTATTAVESVCEVAAPEIWHQLARAKSIGATSSTSRNTFIKLLERFRHRDLLLACCDVIQTIAKFDLRGTDHSCWPMAASPASVHAGAEGLSG